MFQPSMTIVRNGHAVEVVNMDPVMHDIQGYETSLEAGARVLFNTPLVMNRQHNRGDLHAIHNHAPGKSLVGPIYLNKGTADVLYAVRISRVHGKLGDGSEQSVLRVDG